MSELMEMESKAAQAVSDAFQLGRQHENEVSEWQRSALIDLAMHLRYPLGNPHHGKVQAAKFVGWAEECIHEQRHVNSLRGKALEAIVGHLWQGRPGSPGIDCASDLNGIADAVRVLLESANEYQRQLKEAKEEAKNAGIRAGALNVQLNSLQRQHATATDALDVQYRRGYNAALKHVAKAARRMTGEVVEDGMAEAGGDAARETPSGD